MVCMWKGRANLLMYCSCCSNWTRTGCVLDNQGARNQSNNYITPAEFPKGEA